MNMSQMQKNVLDAVSAPEHAPAGYGILFPILFKKGFFI